MSFMEERSQEESCPSELRFKLRDRPRWRNPKQKTTSEMVEEIVKLRNEYLHLLVEAKNFCSKSFFPVMAVDFVYNVNLGEQVGSQTRAETEEMLLKHLEQSKETDESSQDQRRKETVGILKAMQKLQDIFREEMKGTGLLTLQQVCDVHRVLMEGLHDNAGRMRETDAYTWWDGGPYFYTPPSKIEDRFYALIDRHSVYVDSLPPKYSREEVEYVIKVAATLMFEIVDTHPFGDGNGRLCRLLANYVLSLINPFPVGLDHVDGVKREDYINALVHCRENREEGPCDIGAMLVEGVWKGWKRLFINLEPYLNQQSAVHVGPVIVQASKMD